MRLVEDVSLEEADRRRVRTQNALLGFSLGDAFGFAVERSLKPMSGARASQVTDATQLMLTSCEGFVRGILRLKAGKQPTLVGMQSAALARWGAVQPGVKVTGAAASGGATLAWLHRHQLMRRNRRHGKATLRALSDRTGTTKASKGNGGLSRVVPLAFAEGMDPAGVRSVLALTHAHPIALHAGVAVVSIARRMVFEGAHLKAAASMTIEQLQASSDDAGMVVAHRLTEALEAQLSGRAFAAPAYLADGALALAVHAASSTRQLEDALATAASGKGRDAPVVGALTGFFCALEVSGQSHHHYGSIGTDGPIRDGLEMLPREWLDRLEGRDLIERVAADLYRIALPAFTPTADDAMRYPHV